MKGHYIMGVVVLCWSST